MIGSEKMEMAVLDYLREINIVSIILRLSLAMIFGGIIGFDRGKKRRPAGFRTHILVCIGSALAMITNQYIVEVMGMGGDPTRLGAQVISGIGFLGAGTILVTGRQQVKGLTTAAGLWASACMGLAIGVGFYEGAIIGCLFIFGGMTILHRIDTYMLSKSKIVELYIEMESIQNIDEVVAHLRAHQIETTYIEITKSEQKPIREVGVFLTVKQHQKRAHAELISMISQVPTVKYVEEI